MLSERQDGACWAAQICVVKVKIWKGPWQSSLGYEFVMTASKNFTWFSQGGCSHQFVRAWRTIWQLLLHCIAKLHLNRAWILCEAEQSLECVPRWVPSRIVYNLVVVADWSIQYDGKKGLCTILTDVCRWLQSMQLILAKSIRSLPAFPHLVPSSHWRKVLGSKSVRGPKAISKEAWTLSVLWHPGEPHKPSVHLIVAQRNKEGIFIECLCLKSDSGAALNPLNESYRILSNHLMWWLHRLVSCANDSRLGRLPICLVGWPQCSFLQFPLYAVAGGPQTASLDLHWNVTSLQMPMLFCHLSVLVSLYLLLRVASCMMTDDFRLKCLHERIEFCCKSLSLCVTCYSCMFSPAPWEDFLQNISWLATCTAGLNVP